MALMSSWEMIEDQCHGLACLPAAIRNETRKKHVVDPSLTPPPPFFVLSRYLETNDIEFMVRANLSKGDRKKTDIRIHGCFYFVAPGATTNGDIKNMRVVCLLPLNFFFFFSLYFLL